MDKNIFSIDRMRKIEKKSRLISDIPQVYRCVDSISVEARNNDGQNGCFVLSSIVFSLHDYMSGGKKNLQDEIYVFINLF